MASSIFLITPSTPGITFTPAFLAMRLDIILSPIDCIASTDGPIKIIFSFFKALENSAFSDKKP